MFDFQSDDRRTQIKLFRLDCHDIDFGNRKRCVSLKRKILRSRLSPIRCEPGLEFTKRFHAQRS